ncbi:Glycosyl transferase family 2 [Bifidobacterium hapali]|uniref:Glycosyl transferase family 2 n=1 Tax=Bifidobacterium hapali TaxID=1630172 RepID=A0A261G1T0_9BIFI|nr:glycosyltransferase [Bifidobacterium hapali]OZG65394.1 Glycosyl transferase family 2 [Bifidobacterium hapali]
MNNYLVSFIVPVFNGEDFITSLVDNLESQIFKNFEILLMDDASIDNSGKICCDLEKKYDNVKYFKLEHSGIASVRNQGIQHSQGKYITFIDQDDSLSPKSLSSTVPILMANDIDALFFNFDEKYPYKSVIKFNNFPREGIVSASTAMNYFFSERFYGFVWTGIFKKSFIIENKITFNTCFHSIDDIDFVLSVLLKAKYIYFYPKVFYHWTQRVSSESHTNHIDPASDILVFCNRLDELCFLNEKDKSQAYGFFLKQVLMYYGFLYHFNRSSEYQLLSSLRNVALNLIKNINIFDLSFSFGIKVKFILFKMNLLNIAYLFKRS